LLNKLGDLHTYINDEVLTYVVTLPLVRKESYEVIKFIAKSILKSNEVLYIDTRINTVP